MKTPIRQYIYVWSLSYNFQNGLTAVCLRRILHVYKENKVPSKKTAALCVKEYVIDQIAWRWLHVDQFLFCVLI